MPPQKNLIFPIQCARKDFWEKETVILIDNKMSSFFGSLSDLKNLFPTNVHFVIFVGYMALFINQG